MKLLIAISLFLLIPPWAMAETIRPSAPLVGAISGIQPWRERDVTEGAGESTAATTPDAARLAAQTAAPKQPDPTALPFEVGSLRPPARSGAVPRTRWQHRPGHVLWTRAALSALKSHGAPLVDMVPADIAAWCPAYAANDAARRRAFWVGFMSALAKYESTYKAAAVGGGGRWYGLLQILPATARGYKCSAETGAALQSGAANLSCAIRIMARTVPRDGVIYGPNGRGVAADWGPMRSKAKRSEMAGWLKRQSYCRGLGETRPRGRP